MRAIPHARTLYLYDLRDRRLAQPLPVAGKAGSQLLDDWAPGCSDPEMHRRIGLITLIVKDYDEAISFYVQKLGFKLQEDTPLSGEKRWVVVSPASDAETAILLARAVLTRQESAVGDQTGGRVFLFLETDNFWRDFGAFSEKGVHFLESPRVEPYGVVAVFEDLYGNRWDLIQKKAATD
jgi:catechol 2,3-dioxygenase-like lactoylglutathione lyase family enzyme